MEISNSSLNYSKIFSRNKMLTLVTVILAFLDAGFLIGAVFGIVAVLNAAVAARLFLAGNYVLVVH